MGRKFARETAAAGLRQERAGSPVQVAGVQHPSIAALARAYQLPVATVFHRIERGATPEQAVGLEHLTPGTTGHQITVGGKTYPSRSQACEALGVDKRVVHWRLKSGYSVDEAFGLKDFDYKTKPKTVMVQGREFASLRDACRHYGVSKDVLSARINRYGWTLGQALGVEPRPYKAEGVAGIVYRITHRATGKTYVGVTMGSLQTRWEQHLEKAEVANGLAPDSLHQALREHGAGAFVVEQVAHAACAASLAQLEVEHIRRLHCRAPYGYNLNAGGTGFRTGGMVVTVAGKRYASLAAACRAHGLDRRTTNQRLQQGWTTEQAFGLCDAPRSRRGRQAVVRKLSGSAAPAATAHAASSSNDSSLS